MLNALHRMFPAGVLAGALIAVAAVVPAFGQDEQVVFASQQLMRVGPPPEELLDAIEAALRWVKVEDSEPALRELRLAQTLADNMIRVHPASPDWQADEVCRIKRELAAAVDFVMRGLDRHKLSAMRAIQRALSGARKLRLHHELYGADDAECEPAGPQVIVFRPL